MFNIADSEFLNNGIKIIDGIAGAAKSSKTDAFFRNQNIPYSRFASTNRLSRDAQDRYNMEVKTIAAGLFVNQGTFFYAEEKDPPAKNIVIDEILQASPKAITWCINHADKANIILTTDSRQMLSPENEQGMLKAFEQLKSDPNVIYENVTETLRARTEATKALYEELYEKAELPILYDIDYLIKKFERVIDYKDLEYNTSDAYITHDNITEDFLYRDKSFCTNPYLDLIPKGYLSARPPKDLSKYPVLSQLQAERKKIKSYTQVMNVGSPVRFQGSEVDSSKKLYYLVQPNSKVSSRELYTVITRMWDIDSFNIVICDTPKEYKLNTFNNLPVKTHAYLVLPDTGNTIGMTPKEMSNFCAQYDTDEVYYDRTEVLGNNGNLYKYVNTGAKRIEYPRQKNSVGALARRDSKLNYSYMDQVYHILDQHNLPFIRCANTVKRKGDKYGMDVYSAHPTMLAHEKMPIDGKLKTDGPDPDMLNFYYIDEVYTDDTKTNLIITDDLKNYFEKTGRAHCTYLFSTPYSIGCYPGEYLYAQAYNCKESKQEVKKAHYGYYQKHYIEKSIEGDCYVRYPKYIYELLIASVFSQLQYYMWQIYDALNGTAINVDAVSFGCYNEDTVKTIRDILPDYVNFRILDGENKVMRDDKLKPVVLYQSYEELKTRAEKRAEYKKNWYNNLSPERKKLESEKRKERRRKAKEFKEDN